MATTTRRAKVMMGIRVTPSTRTAFRVWCTQRVLVAGVVWHGGKRQEGLQVTLHPLAYRLVVPTQLSPQPLQAPLLEVGVERIEARERRHRHQEVPTSVAHQSLHLALVVTLAGTAEPVDRRQLLLPVSVYYFCRLTSCCRTGCSGARHPGTRRPRRDRRRTPRSSLLGRP